MNNRVEPVAELLAEMYDRPSRWRDLTPEQKREWRCDARAVLAAIDHCAPRVECGDGCSGCEFCRSAKGDATPPEMTAAKGGRL